MLKYLKVRVGIRDPNRRTR